MKESDEHCPAVELRGVSKRFGPRVILDNIDLSVARGEVLALVGPSGSGKSTLLKIVSGIESPDSGRVLLAGFDCTAQPPYRRPVHTVFQNYALFPHLDVASNVAFPLTVAGAPTAKRKKLVEVALGWVKLERQASRRVESLSGGERQRVALARALVDSPQCVLLDEPLSALDPHLRAETAELLQDIQTRLGTTFLFITHDREEALRLGHRIGVLNGGRLEQVGAPEDIYRRPQTAFVASFLGRMNWVAGNLVTDGNQRRLTVAGQAAPHFNGCQLPEGSVKVGIRPEGLRVDPSGWLAANVVGRQFLGDSVIIRVSLADGTHLTVDHRAPLTDAAIGDLVQLNWSADCVHLFPPDGGATQ